MEGLYLVSEGGGGGGGGVGLSDIQIYWSHSIPPKIRVYVFNILYISLNYLHTVKLHLFLIGFFFIGSEVTRSPALDPVSGV